MALFHDLHVVANNGVRLQLYDGVTTVRVRAMSLRAMEDLDERFPGWLSRVMASAEKGVSLASPAAPESQLEALLGDLKQVVPNWRDALVFILADSNPELGITEDWCRAHLFAPDVAAVLKAWVRENGLSELLAALAKKVLDRALVLPRKTGGS